MKSAVGWTYRPADHCIPAFRPLLYTWHQQTRLLSEASILQVPTLLPLPHPVLTEGHKPFGWIQLVISGENALGPPQNSLGGRVIKQEFRCPWCSALLSSGMICMSTGEDLWPLFCHLRRSEFQKVRLLFSTQPLLGLCYLLLRLNQLCASLQNRATKPCWAMSLPPPSLICPCRHTCVTLCKLDNFLSLFHHLWNRDNDKSYFIIRQLTCNGG